ncbi:hypothetical protein [Campylobacter aviculae]|uniref:Uncharacterized protein n=1 Tax=Campylobacter aviculae TaxID=2510190 RepID=A0A4U7BA98_9BACT|nr:hypothetical protein [Campylobacter aviculae]TKX28113.1 hypothetical protein CQA76_08895 [Campylobacter aviculae]
MSLASRVDQYNHELTYLWDIGPKPVESDPSSAEFSQLLQDLNSQASKSCAKDNFDYLKLGTISKEQAYSSLKNISEKMDEVIENVKNQGDEVLFQKLSLLKNFHFKNALGAYATTLNSLENETNGLTSLNLKDLAKELKNINDSLSVSNMILGGVADIAEVFFAMAGVTDVQNDINILKKYHVDSQTQLELNNGTILRVGAVREMAQNIDSKISKIAEDKKNSLLETLLQTI